MPMWIAPSSAVVKHPIMAMKRCIRAMMGAWSGGCRARSSMAFSSR